MGRQTAGTPINGLSLTRYSSSAPPPLAVIIRSMSTEGKSPRILLVRTSAIGDVIHAMPIAVALCAALSPRTSGLGRGRAGRRPVGRPSGDRRADRAAARLAPQSSDGLAGAQATSVPQVRHRHRRPRADEIGRTGLALRRVARIGMDGRWGRELSRWLNNTLVQTDGLHAIPRGLKLLEPLGIVSPGVEFQVPKTAADRRAAEAIIRQCRLDGGFAMLISGRAGRRRFGRSTAMRMLQNTWGIDGTFRAYWFGAATPSARGRSRSPRGWQDTRYWRRESSCLNLPRWPVARGSALGSDTGPLHLAAAAGTPCIGLYGPWPADMHGPYGPRHINVQKMCLDGTTKQRRHAPSLHGGHRRGDGLRGVRSIDRARTPCIAPNNCRDLDRGAGTGSF